MIKPTYYTTQEGGSWKIYGFLIYPSEDYLHLVSTNKGNRFLWYGEFIHSLAFSDPINKPINSFPRWDCINGWTTTIEEVETINEGV